MNVERYREIIRLFLFQYLKHNIQESVDGIGMQPLRICQLRDSVKGSVQNAVSVDQDKLFAITHFNPHNYNNIQITMPIRRQTAIISMAMPSRIIFP